MIECQESREQFQKQIILMEDIKNYKKCKEELSEYCEKRGFTDNIIKEQIIYYMNDYSPYIYGISKNNYKKIKRLVAYKIKEKKYIYLYSLILNNDNNPKIEEKDIEVLNIMDLDKKEMVTVKMIPLIKPGEMRFEIGGEGETTIGSKIKDTVMGKGQWKDYSKDTLKNKLTESIIQKLRQ